MEEKYLWMVAGIIAASIAAWLKGRADILMARLDAKIKTNEVLLKWSEEHILKGPFEYLRKWLEGSISKLGSLDPEVIQSYEKNQKEYNKALGSARILDVKFGRMWYQRIKSCNDNIREQIISNPDEVMPKDQQNILNNIHEEVYYFYGKSFWNPLGGNIAVLIWRIKANQKFGNANDVAKDENDDVSRKNDQSGQDN